MIRHAGLVALRVEGDWRGALIEGPSGAGKSDLALRCVEAGLRLVADDRVVVWASGGLTFGRAPDTLSGLVESRGVGVLPFAVLAMAPVVLAIRCEASAEAVERYPTGEVLDLPGGPVPFCSVWPFDLAAPAKIRRALEHLGYGH